jgi:hypothetical protein
LALVAAAVALLAIACGDSGGDTTTVTLTPARDAPLFGTINEVSNGGGNGLQVGRTRSGSLRRSLVAFDVASTLPAGAEVRSVELALTLSRVRAGSQEEIEITLHRALADWGEGEQASPNEGDGAGVEAVAGDVTWTSRFLEGELWETEGGDFESEASATITVEAIGSYTVESTSDLTDDVQAWLDDPSSNFGWILIGDEELRGSAKRFNSSEHEDSTTHPVLTIGFVAPEE